MPSPTSNEFRAALAAALPAYATTVTEAIETTAPSVAVRVNTSKCVLPHLPAIVSDSDGRVPWCEEGFYLPQRPDFTHDPALHQGLYYVQDASSMAVGTIAGMLAGSIPAPLRCLDACAAPGGKTTAILSALPQGSLVVANEFDYRRAEILRENIIKWGSPYTVVSRGDTACYSRLKEFFHIIAADVPCSGEGMMRKDPRAAEQWSLSLVHQCAERQKEIIANLWPALMPGGYLVYSTCTFNTAENERMLDWIVESYPGAEILNLDPRQFPGAVMPGSMLRFLPGLVRGEGLAVGVIRKAGDIPAEAGATLSSQRRGKSKDLRQPTASAAWSGMKTPSWACESFEAEASLTHDGTTLRALPAPVASVFSQLSRCLDIIYAGVEVCTLKGKKEMPLHPLAMSTTLRDGAFPKASLNLQTTLSYLRREALPGLDAPKGPVLVTFGDHPLGFANNLGNRANNLYPAPWRILT